MKRGFGGKLTKWLVGLFIALAGAAVVLVLLSAIVLPRVIGSSQKARRTATVVQMRTLMSALDRYRIDNNARLPSNEQGLAALIREPSGPPKPKRWRGPYLDTDELPRDGWDKDYSYAAADEGREYRLCSLGADGVEGGVGHDADIKSWEPATWADG